MISPQCSELLADETELLLWFCENFTCAEFDEASIAVWVWVLPLVSTGTQRRGGEPPSCWKMNSANVSRCLSAVHGLINVLRWRHSSRNKAVRVREQRAEQTSVAAPRLQLHCGSCRRQAGDDMSGSFHSQSIFFMWSVNYRCPSAGERINTDRINSYLCSFICNFTLQMLLIVYCLTRWIL